jgi:integrase
MARRKKGIRGGGSVFQRKSDKRWVAKFLVEETGKYKSLYADTEREAYEKLQLALQQQRQGILASGPNQKLSDFLTWWLEEVHRRTIRDSTYLRYRGLLNNHIIPELGHYQLQKLTTQRIQALSNKKLKEGQSPSSVHAMQHLLHAALEYALKGRLISHNPSAGVSLPAVKKRKTVPLTLEQARHLIATARPPVRGVCGCGGSNRDASWRAGCTAVGGCRS